MHLFQLSAENPGELEFRYPWLPYWLVHNRELLDAVHKEVKESIPPEIKASEMREHHYKALDKVAIDVMCRPSSVSLL